MTSPYGERAFYLLGHADYRDEIERLEDRAPEVWEAISQNQRLDYTAGHDDARMEH